MKIGFIGLGKMGSRMALKLLEGGHEIVTWARSESTISDFKLQISNSINTKNLLLASNLKDLVNNLEVPRVVWLMLPAGLATQSILDQLNKFVTRDDIVIDGGNSYYEDTDKRYQKYKRLGIRYLGIGVSGGIIAAKDGYPLMVGGEKSAYEYIRPILVSLAKPNGGYEYFGQGGAGHFVKMVHNGIEYGMLQAIGEGFSILKKSEYNLDLSEVSRVWQKGSIISGFLLDRSAEVFSGNQDLENITGNIPRGGEGDWTVAEAKRLGIDISIIKDSVDFRKRSERDKSVQNSFTAKMINALRNAFGGHKVQRNIR